MTYLDIEKISESEKEKSLKMFVQKVKKHPIYSVYEHAVKEKRLGDATKLLQTMITLMFSEDEPLAMSTVYFSFALFFTMADQKLQDEILFTDKN